MGSCQASTCDEAIDRIYDYLTFVVKGEEVQQSMLALSMVLADQAMELTLDPKEIKDLYYKLADSAVKIVNFRQYGICELQTEEDPPQKTKRKPSPKATGDEPDPSEPD